MNHARITDEKDRQSAEHLATAHAELDRLYAVGAGGKATGSVVVELHMTLGGIGAVKSSITKVVK